MCFTERGEGWAPAVPNSSAELDNISGGQQMLNVTHYFLIGGSTFGYQNQPINFTQYLQRYSGKQECLSVKGPPPTCR